MSNTIEKLTKNKYFSLFITVFFIIFIIVEYNQGDDIPLAFLGVLLMIIPQTIYLFNTALENNKSFSLVRKVLDYTGKGVIIFFVFQVIYKLCKLNGYL